MWRSKWGSVELPISKNKQLVPSLTNGKDVSYQLVAFLGVFRKQVFHEGDVVLISEE